ncbi:uncharacterized protein LOC110057163 [Orbicella faveolata]|uniref:uncharacterized protein LOC110057163 n=1 Tax=Orbicella faveolata TaxID=48498 RepID=UPI0009E636B5|nr:uncharacterized protein LOC110057163 [Orbicella faveolata]
MKHAAFNWIIVVRFYVGFVNGHSDEYDVINAVVSSRTSLSNVSLVLKEFNTSADNTNLFDTASALLDHNTIVLIEGSNTKMSACTLSSVTGIPLIRFHGDSRSFDQCEKAIQMSAGYKEYALATRAILNTFGWKNIALVYDASRWHEAGNFFAISRSSGMTVNFVQLSEQDEDEDSSVPVLRALEQIKDFEVDIILLYIEKQKIELMLQQVPLKLSCYQNVVVSLKLTYVQNSASDELERNHNKTTKELLAFAYDSVQVINQAVNTDPCLSINGSLISSEDTEAMLTCLKKISLDGLTGPVNFNEYGQRKKTDLEILNLRNNSFKKIGTWNSTKGAVLFGSVLRNMDNPLSKGSLEGRKLRAVVALVGTTRNIKLDVELTQFDELFTM